jgi:periplasmic protein TonB
VRRVLPLTPMGEPMRRVYTPPESGSWTAVRALGAILITLGVFLVLPLTQLVSSYSKRELFLTKVDSTVLQAPSSPDEPPPPPPVEEEPPEPEPNLAESQEPLTITVDLEMAVGAGGAMPMNLLGGSAEAARDIAQALDVSELDKPPALIAAVPPRYPLELRRARVEGTVALVFLLTEEGRVEDVRVESSSRPEFEQPAMEAIRRWRYKPGMKDGEAVKTYMRQPIRFSVAS